MDEQLIELLRIKDFKSAKKIIDKEWTVENLKRWMYSKEDLDLFRYALYDFLEDYDIMEFLVKNGFNNFRFPECAYCVCSKTKRMWGIVGRAYFVQDKRILDLLFQAGFGVAGSGNNVGGCIEYNGNTDYPFWKYVYLIKFDKSFIDQELSYGVPINCMKGNLYEPDYDLRAYNYLNSNPKIILKGYSLCPNWEDEIVEPQQPHISFFMSRSKKEYILREYEKAMQEYIDKKRVQKEFISKITPEEWQLIRYKGKKDKEISALMSSINFADLINKG